MTTMLAPYCVKFKCKHFRIRSVKGKWCCKAFPEGIPREILYGNRGHIIPYPGDHGIQLEPIDWEILEAVGELDVKPKVKSPEDIAKEATKQRSVKQQVGKWVAAGEFEKLNIKQLEEQAKKFDIPVARNKSDFIRLLEPLEPGLDWKNIKGAELKKLLRKYKISSRRSKEELVQLLKNAQAIKALEKSVK